MAWPLVSPGTVSSNEKDGEMYSMSPCGLLFSRSYGHFLLYNWWQQAEGSHPLCYQTLK
jgi:hypothetical protein